MFAVFKEEMGREEEPRAVVLLENLRGRDQLGADGIIILKRTSNQSCETVDYINLAQKKGHVEGFCEHG
jgi:hypothetical protein